MLVFLAWTWVCLTKSSFFNELLVQHLTDLIIIIFYYKYIINIFVIKNEYIYV